MFQKIWRWLKNLWQQWFSPTLPPVEPPPIPHSRSDAEYESGFMQVLDGVNQGWSRGQVRGFLIAQGIDEVELVPWLQQFGSTLQESPERHQELARRMVQLGQVGSGEWVNVAGEIGKQVLARVDSPPSPPSSPPNSAFRESEDAKDWYRRGVKQSEAGNLDAALACFERAVQLQPDDHFAWYGKGYALSQLGQLTEALACFERALRLQPDNHLAWNGKGNMLRELGQLTEALACFERAVQLQPDYHFAWNGKGLVLRELGQLTEAVTCYERALHLQPDCHFAWDNKGIVLRELGQLSQALACSKRALHLQPDFHHAWNHKGNVLRDLGQLSEALACYERALHLQPDFHHAWYGKGSVVMDLGQLSEALACYERALHLQPGDYHVWNGKGDVLSELGQPYQALACYERALQLTHNQYWIAWANRGWEIFKLRGYQAALDNWNQGLQSLQSDKPDYQKGCGVLHQCKGDAYYLHGRTHPNPYPYWRDAKRSYRQALNFLNTTQLRQLRLEVLQALIKVCRGLGDDETAQALLVEGSELLGRLLQEMPSDAAKISLSRKFASFNQCRVDSLVQLGNFSAALDLAEQRKNLCLRWLRYGWVEPSDAGAIHAVSLPNPQTAAIYWHISPAAITTFILKYNQPPVARILALNTTTAGAAKTLHSFEEWLNQWNELVETGFKPDTTDESRQLEPDTLVDLANILDIPAILPLLEGITQLILIPHRDLHLLPLHALFPDDVINTYLPSLQMGIDLQRFTPPTPLIKGGARDEDSLSYPEETQQSSSPPYQGGARGGFQGLLSIEHPQTAKTQDKDKSLLYAEIESAAITQLYQPAHRLVGDACTLDNLLQAFNQTSGIFHFTGHAYHNLNSPANSALLLANTAQLTLRDIFENKLDFSRYHLICLSACETGKTGKQGFIGPLAKVAGEMAKVG